MRRFVSPLLVATTIALAACSANSQTVAPGGTSPSKAASASPSPTAVDPATQPATPTRVAATSPTVTVPLEKARRACLLTVAQATQVMGTDVKEVKAGGSSAYREECDYSSITEAEVTRLTPTLTPAQFQALSLRGIQMIVDCGPNNSAPWTALSGGCWLHVAFLGVTDQTETQTAEENILKIAVPAWNHPNN
jgi:hypothetical protein